MSELGLGELTPLAAAIPELSQAQTARGEGETGRPADDPKAESPGSTRNPGPSSRSHHPDLNRGPTVYESQREWHERR